MATGKHSDTAAVQRAAGAAGVLGLGAVTVVHAAWALGSSWPAADRDQLADLVVGRRPFPGPVPTWGVVALLGAATALTAARAELVRFPGGRSAWPVRVGTDVLAGTLLVRGAGGLVVSGLGLGNATALFRRWDLALYSPLCLGLAGLVARASRAPRPRRLSPLPGLPPTPPGRPRPRSAARGGR